MDRFPTRLGVAELQATFGDPHRLATLANRIAGLRDLGHRHAVAETDDGTLAFTVRTKCGKEHRSTAGEFSVYVAESLILLRREWSALIADKWAAIKARLDDVRPYLSEAVKNEVRFALIAGIDEFNFDSPLTMESWALIRAHRVVEHRQQLERDADKPIYKADDDIKRDPEAKITGREAIDEVFAALTEQEDIKAVADLFERQLHNIRFLRPVKVREVAKLRLLKQLTFRKIAERLDIKLQTAVNRFNSAKEKLKAQLTSRDLELWREIQEKEPAPSPNCVAPSHQDTRQPALPRQVGFAKYLRTLPAEQQKQIQKAEREYAKDHAERAVTLSELFSELFPAKDRNEGDEARRPTRQNGTGTAAAYADGLRVTNLRGAKLSAAAIDQGTVPFIQKANFSTPQNGTHYD